MSLTVKQAKIMTILCVGNPKNTNAYWCDFDQLIERLEERFLWKTTKQSLQFSIRALIRKKMIYKKGKEIRRGRSRVILAPTTLGLQVTRATVVLTEDLETSMINTPDLKI